MNYWGRNLFNENRYLCVYFMKILKCIICYGEVDIIESTKGVKCKKCGFTNIKEEKEPEIIIIKKKPISGG